ncbi:MAG: 23S rRNA (uracil(1939)-C(5))-methyltransferase RlmD [Anaerovoracaceae bacterium]
MMFTKGQQVKIEIIDISNEGQGIGKAEGLAVFVGNTVIGDQVTAELTKVKKNYAFGKLISIDQPSPHRITPLCQYADQCGGCPFASTDYAGQLAVKQKQVADRLSRISGIENPRINEIISMEEPFAYRNKATFPISTGGNIMRKGGIIENLGEPAIGFYKGKSHDVVDCQQCLIQSPAAMAAAAAMRQFMIEDHITAWDEKWQQGLMKSMVVKTAFATGEVMVVLNINGKGIPASAKLIQMLDDYIYEAGYSLESVVLDNEKEIIPLAGKQIIKEEIGQLSVELSPRSFYQVNPAMAKELYELVRTYAGLTGTENVLDLYCGVGSIGLYCAKEAGYVLGIESLKDAVLDANRNAVINGIVNARFLCGKAEEALPKLLAGEGDEDLVRVARNADVVILDPPRAGCQPWLLDAVAEVAPAKIVYVSCDPATLARDVKYLGDHGYEFVEATPVDMFAWTGHVETAVLMSRVEK